MKRDDTPMWTDPEEPAYVRELLEAGRAESIHYDVSAGLAKHVAAVGAGAALPEWAQGSATVGSGAATSAWVGWVVVPVVAATLATGVWLATSRDAAERPAAQSSTQSVQPVAVRAAAPVTAIEPARVEVTPAAPQVVERSTSKAQAIVRKPVREIPTLAAKVDAPKATPKSVSSSASAPKLAARSVVVHETEPRSSAALAPAPSAAEPPARASATAAEPEPQAQSESRLEREMQMLAVAQRVLASDPERALRLAQQGEREFPRTMFSAERQQLALLAMVKLGRLDEARRVGQGFLSKYPNAPWSARLRRALATGRVE